MPAAGEREARVALYPLRHQLSHIALARLQHTQSQGGPCGVLAPVQALLLKHLMFDGAQPMESSGSDVLAVPPPLAQRALLRGLEEALWGCGAPRGEALVASLLPTDLLDDALPADGSSEVLIDSVSALHSLVRVPCTHAFQRPCLAVLPPTPSSAPVRHHRTPSPHLQHARGVCVRQVGVRRCVSRDELRAALAAATASLQSGAGALLILFSMLLSRGLDATSGDRDDPSMPLVAPPFGHASQEIVNLFLCGRAVPNVFDGCMDLGEGMKLQGVPATVQVRAFLPTPALMSSTHVGHHSACMFGFCRMVRQRSEAVHVASNARF